MPNMEFLQNILSWILIGGSVVAIIFAVKETKEIPLRTFFTLSELSRIPRMFFLLMGIASILLTLNALLLGSYLQVLLFSIIAILQFTQTRKIPIDRDINANKT
ncbi:MAG: hypothetical protein JKY88_01750 [Pseudomonadales bacterium]|nr:hypothetical protein [Pseudomonadales bacterium]